MMAVMTVSATVVWAAEFSVAVMVVMTVSASVVRVAEFSIIAIKTCLAIFCSRSFRLLSVIRSNSIARFSAFSYIRRA